MVNGDLLSLNLEPQVSTTSVSFRPGPTSSARRTSGACGPKLSPSRHCRSDTRTIASPGYGPAGPRGDGRHVADIGRSPAGRRFRSKPESLQAGRPVGASGKSVLIVNPAAAAGSAGRRWPAIAELVRSASLDFDAVLTTR